MPRYGKTSRMTLWRKTTRRSDVFAQKSAAPIVFDRPRPMAPPMSAPSRSVTSVERSRVSMMTMKAPRPTPIKMLTLSTGWNGRVRAAAHATAAMKHARVMVCQGMAMTPGIKSPSYPTPLIRPARLGEAGFDLQGVPVIQLLQHGVRQPHAIELPEGVVRPVVVEILIVRLENPPVIGILRCLVSVLPEHHPVLVFGEKLCSRIRLAAELVEDGGHFEADVGERVEQFRGAPQVVAVPREVRGDEPRLRVLGEHVIAFLHQLLERRIAARGPVPIL